MIDESRVLYTDEQILVINKLPGEAMEGAGAGMIDLPRLLAEQYGTVKKGGGGEFPPTAVHRLDVPVSGCALFARTPQALSSINAAFSRGRAERYYWAVIENPPPSLVFPETGELFHWIETDKKQNKSFAHDKKGPKRQEGILRYRVKGRGHYYTFLEIELVTGRHHQIRAQLAALGIHIKGDLKYGARRSEKGGGIRLHARSLYFPEPSKKGSVIQVTASPPVQDRLWRDFERPATFPD
ncbi:MAG: RNA pseudouridine synthase [Spirochaetaceae bacterium]|jgi:23S rRNA pseudouridine1911/1915/1917 synthase|nr:RNA pseudouridine synthase [Spirochaetaceae bacterium]